MNTIQSHILKHQVLFSRHPFFKVIEDQDSLEPLAKFAPELTFWVMVFQDILRINESKVVDPDLRKIAKHHRIEDSGHEKWFLEDLNALAIGKPPRMSDIPSLFSPRHTATRDAAYALMSEVFRAENDTLRIVLLLALESSAHTFFVRVSNLVERTGNTSNLKYFSKTHLDAEESHAAFEEEMANKILSLTVNPEVRQQAAALVDRVYAAFSAMFDGWRNSGTGVPEKLD